MARPERPAWQPISTATGWSFTACQALGSTYRVPEFRYDPESGWVEVRGALSCNSTGVAVLLTIPTYLRPSGNAREPFACTYQGGTARFDMTVTEIRLVTPATLTSGDFFSISGIRWNIGP